QTPQLKREYLCIAVADDFVGSLFATRADIKTGTNDKRMLQLYGAIEPSTIAAFSKDIKSILESNIPSAEELKRNLAQKAAESEAPGDVVGEMPGAILARAKVDDHLIAGAAALCQWERHFPVSLLSQSTLPLSGAFFAWQLQFQDKLRSQLNEHRNLAKSSDKNSAFQTISTRFLSQAREALQSPLTTIKTALTLLNSPTLKLAQRQRYLEMITTQCEMQKSLINSIMQLLELQISQREESQAIKLADLIPGIVSTYQPLAEERGIMLAYTVPDSLPSISGIEVELKQIVIHLLKNAIHTTPQNGKVWVAARRHTSAKFVVLTIQDSGNGVAPADIPKLFEAFAHTPSNRHGSDTALGLTLVQQLVQRMDGSISVESGNTQGTTFKILLPVHPLPGAETALVSQSHGVQVPKAVVNDSQSLSSHSNAAQTQLNDVEKNANISPAETKHQPSPEQLTNHNVPASPSHTSTDAHNSASQNSIM
ncbi:MAG: HAMP domain-containing sensor histidine kinase, partial [Cyanobacteria bacterium J06632_3]